ELGAFGVHLDRIAIQTGLGGDAVQFLGGARAVRPGRDVARRGQSQGRIRQTRQPALAHGLAQGGVEIDVTRLVVGRVGVGDVGRQDFLPLLAQRQGFLVELEVLADSIDHGYTLKRMGGMRDHRAPNDPPTIRGFFAQRHSTGSQRLINVETMRGLKLYSSDVMPLTHGPRPGLIPYNGLMRIARSLPFLLLAALLPGTVSAQTARPVLQDPAAVVAQVQALLQDQAAAWPGRAVINVDAPRIVNQVACDQLETSLSSAGLQPRTAVAVRCLAPQPWTIYVQATVQILGRYFVASRLIQ